MKDFKKKLNSTLHSSIYQIEGLSGDEQLVYRKMMDEILEVVDENYSKPIIVKKEVSKILDDHAQI